MCGINGVLSFKNIAISKEINSMNNLIIHRGPDDDGTFIEENDNYSLALGMRRLSIIDIESGSQPIFSDDKQVIIVFNGEIYNYQKLKKELEESNISFKTNSDTEVILKLYLKFGTESFSKLDGMFAFSIYDKRKNKLFIARDFFGEKPLYYAKNSDSLVWASELKSILCSVEKPKISIEGSELFFKLNYIPAPYTIYEGILKLSPNNYIEFDIKTKELLIKPIHIEEKIKQESSISFNSAKNITKNLIEESVFSRSISDVPIGTFLSGGVDSSIISYCLAKNLDQRINTFSIGFENKKFDETHKSRVVSKLINSKHNEFIINENSLVDEIDNILMNFDEPFADASALATFLVSKQTRNHVKVALTGDGGDEVFAGYNKHYMSLINNRYTTLIPSRLHNSLKTSVRKLLVTKNDNRGLRFKLRKTLDSLDYNGNFYWNIISLGFQENEIKKLLIVKKQNDSLDYFKKKLNDFDKDNLFGVKMIDKIVSLEGDMLAKVDRTSMLSSLECRAPFLNKKIWDFTNTLPDNYLINKGRKKFILKEGFKDYFPDRFLDKSKKGFGVPVGDWLRGVLSKELISYTNKKFIEEQGIFNHAYISKLVYDHLNGKEDATFKMWPFYCFQKWYKNIYLS
jgi:asparagine synthase (glutamine-hydrolysing)